MKPTYNRKTLVKAGVAVIAIFAIIAVITTGNDTPTEKRQHQIEEMFSPWDGSHTKLKELTKEAMNDPGSYEHIGTVWVDEGSYVLVTQSYTGKNAFGGRVRGFIKAKVDLKGNIIEVVEQH